MKRIVCLIVICLLSGKAHAQSPEHRFRLFVDSIYQANPKATGIVVHVTSPNRKISWTYATGYSNKATGEKLSADQPVLLASNTKTYVCATILKLIELHKIQLNEPIDELISKKSRDLLSGKGYKTKDITVKHLLSHTSGIDDYANDAYFDFVNTHKKYAWTRAEQIELAMKTGTILGAPGDTFKYADVNYLLLTEIIEHCTGKSFYTAIRDLLDFKGHHLNATWFVDLEKKPKNILPFAHQYWEKFHWDSYDLNPSWDLYGGGGLAGTAADLTMFFQLLFEGKIIKNQQVLSMMYTDVPTKRGKTNYCLGLRKLTIAGLTGYYHGGFWGTDAIYFPELHASISIFVLERSERDISATICADIVNALKELK